MDFIKIASILCSRLGFFYQIINTAYFLICNLRDKQYFQFLQAKFLRYCTIH